MSWSFPCRVIDVHDGDTVKVEVDLGFEVRYQIGVRLYNVYAPELADPPDPTTGSPGGPATRQAVVDWLLAHSGTNRVWPFSVATTRLPAEPDSFDRYVGELADYDGISLNTYVRNDFLKVRRYGRGVATT